VRTGAVALALAWSIVPIALLAAHVARHGGVLTGADGPLAGADQLFYMDSIRQSGEHLLIADHFDLTIGHAVFLNPLFLLAGVVWRLGAPLQAAFWLLQLVAAPALALGAAAVAAVSLRSRGERAAAVVIGLFYLSPIVPLLIWTGAVGALKRYELTVPAGESMPAWQLWGYPHAALAAGALAGALVMSTRIIEARTERPGRAIALAALCACAAAWLHPWQGATFILVAVALAVQARARYAIARLIVPVAAAAAPLVYEAILPRVDRAWHVDSLQNAVGHEPVWMVAAALAPLALPALLGIRRVGKGAVRAMLIAWPIAAVAVYLATDQFPYHALQGISLPLAALAVAGWSPLVERLAGWRPALTRLAHPPVRTGAAVALVALMTVPAVAFELRTFRDSEHSGAAPYWFAPGERAALAYLERIRPAGGVLSRQYLGMTVPAFTGRRTWVGEWTWTPDYAQRSVLAERLMAGEIPPQQARGLVTGIGARFVLTDCGAPATIPGLLGPLVVSQRRFGCAAVYMLAPAAVRTAAASASERPVRDGGA
jgi:hypothetical protein